jgi:hypothetical protein
MQRVGTSTDCAHRFQHAVLANLAGEAVPPVNFQQVRQEVGQASTRAPSMLAFQRVHAVHYRRNRCASGLPICRGFRVLHSGCKCLSLVGAMMDFERHLAASVVGGSFGIAVSDVRTRRYLPRYADVSD